MAPDMNTDLPRPPNACTTSGYSHIPHQIKDASDGLRERALTNHLAYFAGPYSAMRKYCVKRRATTDLFFRAAQNLILKNLATSFFGSGITCRYTICRGRRTI